MSMQERPPLDDEERQLAAQLTRIAPRGEPSAELDARILAMAERGVASNAAPARRRRARWPAWLGVAASLTAVAGLIWQVHPILGPSAERIAPVAISSADHTAADGDERQPIRYVGPNAEMVPPTPPPPPLPPPRETRSTVQVARAPAAAATDMVDSTPVAAQAPPRAAVPSKPAQNTPITADITGAPEPAASAETVPLPWPADAVRKATPASSTRSKASDSVNVAPPSPVASSPTAAERSEASGNRLQSARPVAAPMPAPAIAPPTSKHADSSDTLEFDERPPATTANIDVQKTWLERIRTLKNAGKLDEARQSLKEFRQRHPNAETPADLKPLLATGTS